MPGGDAIDVGTRSTLHAVAAHCPRRRRHDVSGRFGLRATPGGFGTPAFGEAPEVVRVAGTSLVREVGRDASTIGLAGSTLSELAAFTETDLSRAFSVGGATPELPDTELPLTLEIRTVEALARWYALGWAVLDAFVCGLAFDAKPATIQLWPEHFDAGTTVSVPGRDKVNVGFSPGDAFEAEPYVYLGPWGAERPGGAVLGTLPSAGCSRRPRLAPDRTPPDAASPS